MPPTRAVAKKKKAAARKKAKKVADAALTLAVEVVPMKEPKKKKGGAAKKKKAAAKKKKAAAVKKPRAPRVRKPSAILREDTPHESAAEHDEYMRRYAGVIDRRSGRFKGVTRGDWERWFERDPVTKRISRRDKTREWPVHKQLAPRADKEPRVISTVPLRPEGGGKKKKKAAAAKKKKSGVIDAKKLFAEMTPEERAALEREMRANTEAQVAEYEKRKKKKAAEAPKKNKEPTLADVKKVWMEVPGRVGNNPPAPKKKKAAAVAPKREKSDAQKKKDASDEISALKAIMEHDRAVEAEFYRRLDELEARKKKKAAAKPFFDKPAKKPRAGNKKKAAAAASVLKEVPRAALPDGMEWIESRLNDANVPTPSVAVTTTPLPPPPDNYPPPPPPPVVQPREQYARLVELGLAVDVPSALANIQRVRMALISAWGPKVDIAVKLLRKMRPDDTQETLYDVVMEMANQLRTSLTETDLERINAEVLPGVPHAQAETTIKLTADNNGEFRGAMIEVLLDAIRLKRIQEVVNTLGEQLPKGESVPVRNRNGVIVAQHAPVSAVQAAEAEFASELHGLGVHMEKG